MFETVGLEALRLRRSEKWTKHPADVLPSHIAEMDFALAPPIAVGGGPEAARDPRIGNDQRGRRRQRDRPMLERSAVEQPRRPGNAEHDPAP